MYLAHFDIGESPFSITPDPRFVYLSMRHREALAHLLYGLREGGGFVQLTGEVGTGKTTICRTLLKQLPEHVDVALIFNPQLTVPELLESICTELHVELPTENRSIKALIDRLYSHLLDANAGQRRTVLIIDEAQNLSEDVLEQVRLLTNLETDDAKLLQVFLIGQPELRSMLDRKELRQVWQRVTARYHLEALDLDETRHYIRHRLSVAGCDREIFTKRAVRRVYRLTGGIPRRINILCDRALLGAYTTNTDRVDGATVDRACKEIEGRKATIVQRIPRYAMVTAAVTAVMAITGIALGPKELSVLDWIDRTSVALESRTQAQAARENDPPPPDMTEEPAASDASAGLVADIASLPDNGPSPTPEPLQMSELTADSMPPVSSKSPSTAPSPSPPPSEPSPALESPPPSPPSVTPAPQPLSAEEVVAGIDGDGWLQAVLALSRLWHVPPPSAGASMCDWARDNALECYSKPLSWSALSDFDLPAVLELSAKEESAVHVVLFGLAENEATVLVDGDEHAIERAELERVWRGDQILLWRPPLASNPPIRLGQGGQRVRWLRDTLALIDGGDASSGEDDRFDAALLERVKDFQRQRGLDVDGIVGPQTFIHLAVLTRTGETPSLAAAANAGGRGPRETSVAMEAR